jgi:probable F420-dependent oxidoreductase
MRIGFSIPTGGALATPEAVTTIAQRAEELGYDTLWTFERLLYAVNPQNPYPATPNGAWPQVFRRVLDPLDTLTFAAAHTKKIFLGTSVLNIPFYNPVTIARRLTTIDYLSNGRLRVGFGLGWSQDEMDATGADMKRRGPRADEFLQVLKAIWTQNPVEFHGKFFQLPKSYIDLKPVQKPHPPIYLAAFVPAALARVAKLADGWNPAGITVEGMAQMFSSIKQIAAQAGRDASCLELVVRANLRITEKPLGNGRQIFSGTLEQIQEDAAACVQIGAHEVHFAPEFGATSTVNGTLALLDQLRAFVSA